MQVAERAGHSFNNDRCLSSQGGDSPRWKSKKRIQLLRILKRIVLGNVYGGVGKIQKHQEQRADPSIDKGETLF